MNNTDQIVQDADVELSFLSSVVKENGNQPAALIPILQMIQEKYRYLPKNAMEFVADALGLSPATVYGVATFYAQFSLEPKGKYVIKVCDGTACHVRGSSAVYDAICKRVELVDGKSTTKDGTYTVETVSCLGACVLAPVVTINDKVYGEMTPEAINIILDTLEKEGTNHDQNA
ncbi:MAG: NADH-quinone oxidoreductase subunit NuoE [Firmicutes bacterium]|nr:NADH-quinone oxidoreductase subunit NuoE [Bacillota bacterium]